MCLLITRLYFRIIPHCIITWSSKEISIQTLIAKFKSKKVTVVLLKSCTFSVVINEVLKGLPFAFAYLDDILIFYQKHWESFWTSKEYLRLRMTNLTMKRKKCDFFKSELHYLGHVISGKGIYLLPEKLPNI